MDTCSSGEDLVIKPRKPYTITKQRERWTDEEHNRFLEALKLYGRAWQRIEEHIGTKTAVQIRSHAQKFFSKLEKEALVKGVPIGQALDVDIPPPRPKRKPSNPYPRKIGVGGPTQQVGAKDGRVSSSLSSLCSKPVLDLEKEPLPERPSEDEKQTNAKENQDENCSEVFSHLHEGHCSSVSSGNKSSIPTVVLRNSCTFREFVPLTKEIINQEETNESNVTIELEGNQKFYKADERQTVQDNGTSEVSNLENLNLLHEKSVQSKKIDDLNGALPADEMQATQNYPRHVHVQVLDGNLGTCTQTQPDVSFRESIFHPMREVHGRPSLLMNPGASATTEHQRNSPRSVHQSYPTFHPPFTPIHFTQDDYRSFLHISSAFSSLVVSTLLQNPAAHAAASFAATFWPYSNMETSADSPACTHGGFPVRQMNSTPSAAAIAAATVAAATAWWAAHGLLPLCAPVHTDFTCASAPATDVPSTENGQASVANTERLEKKSQSFTPQHRQLNPEYSDAVQAQHSASKSSTLSSSDSEESGGAKLNTGAKVIDHEKSAAAAEVHDPNKTKIRNQVDRSSCGSNDPSSSEVETDGLKKHEKGEKCKEELKVPDANHPATETSNRRSKTVSNMNDSWKEVSEGGRLAFEALFSREVLPQSFSPPHDLMNMEQLKNNIEEDKHKIDEKTGDASLLDLNSRTLGSCSGHQGGDNNVYKGLLTIGLGHGKFKACRTGFKPYKRCSVEAKENRVTNASTQGEERGPKRIRMEGDMKIHNCM